MNDLEVHLNRILASYVEIHNNVEINQDKKSQRKSEKSKKLKNEFECALEGSRIPFGARRRLGRQFSPEQGISCILNCIDNFGNKHGNVIYGIIREKTIVELLTNLLGGDYRTSHTRFNSSSRKAILPKIVNLLYKSFEFEPKWPPKLATVECLTFRQNLQIY